MQAWIAQRLTSPAANTHCNQDLSILIIAFCSSRHAQDEGRDTTPIARFVTLIPRLREKGLAIAWQFNLPTVARFGPFAVQGFGKPSQ